MQLSVFGIQFLAKKFADVELDLKTFSFMPPYFEYETSYFSLPKRDGPSSGG